MTVSLLLSTKPNIPYRKFVSEVSRSYLDLNLRPQDCVESTSPLSNIVKVTGTNNESCLPDGCPRLIMISLTFLSRQFYHGCSSLIQSIFIHELNRQLRTPNTFLTFWTSFIILLIYTTELQIFPFQTRTCSPSEKHFQHF